MIPDLVVLGNLLLDDVVLPDGRTRMAEPGGATLYTSLGACLWGTRVGVVSLRGDDYPSWVLSALAERGVDLSGVHALRKPGLRTWLLYEGRRRQVVHRLDQASHAEVSPTSEDIPRGWLAARAFHLAPVPFDAQKALVRSLSVLDGAFVSVDPHLPLREATLQAWREVLGQADAFFLSEDELETTDDARPALRGLATGRLRLVVFKRGARGGIVYGVHGDRFLEWSATALRVSDPTGAGDAFAGGFLAGWLAGGPLERAVECGVVAASFAIEDWGPAGLLEATPQRAEARRREWFPP